MPPAFFEVKMVIDSVGETLNIGDLAVYAKSGYCRPAKILDIAQRGTTQYLNYSITVYDITVVTATSNRTAIRKVRHEFTTPAQGWSRAWSLYRLDRIPADAAALIDQRIEKERRKKR